MLHIQCMDKDDGSHMYTEMISPRFCETDALGHINNTVLPVWFEKAREPIFRFFTPDLDVNSWCLIVAKIDVEFKAQIHYGSEVCLKTSLQKIGNSSISVQHEAWQNEVLCAKGIAILVNFDYQLQQAVSIPESIRQQLEEHLSY